MKILFFTRLYYPHVGGIEKHLEKINEILIKKGNEVVIVATKHDQKLFDEEIYKQIRIIRFTQPKIKFVGLLYTWIWLIKNYDLIKNTDILHIHDVFNWFWPFKIINPGRVVFLTIHGRWGEYPIPWKDKIQKKIAAYYSAGVLAIGEYIPENYGIKADIVSYGATEIPVQYKLKSKSTKNIVYVGRMDKDIALTKSFAVFERLKDYKIDFCGDGELKSEAKKYGDVHGFTHPEPYYQQARYCFASGYLTIIEALANKCLVFTLYEHPLQEDYYKLTPFRDFINVSSEPDEIYEKLKYYEENPQEAEELIEKGYLWARNQTWDKMVNNYLSLWDNGN